MSCASTIFGLSDSTADSLPSGWVQNTALSELTAEKARESITDKMRKDLKAAFELAAEQNPVDHYKEILKKFQEEQLGLDWNQAAATAKKPKKGKAKAAEADDDVDMDDADAAPRSAKSKKRKAEDDTSVSTAPAAVSASSSRVNVPQRLTCEPP